MKIRTCQKKNLKITDLSKRMEAVLLIVSTPLSPISVFVEFWANGRGAGVGGKRKMHILWNFGEIWGIQIL